METNLSEELNNEKITRMYEFGYLFVSNLTEEEAKNKVEDIKNLIVKEGGEVIENDNPSDIDLAYEMEKTIDNKKVKFDRAYFGSIFFKITPEGVVSLKKVFDFDSQILRFLLIKTDSVNIFDKDKISKNSRSSKKIKPEEVKGGELDKDEEISGQNQEDVLDDKNEESAV